MSPRSYLWMPKKAPSLTMVPQILINQKMKENYKLKRITYYE